MYEFALRWHVQNGLPQKRDSARTLIANAKSEMLRFSPKAAEILSYLCGSQLKRSQRQILAQTLDEHVNQHHQDPAGAGPLSQTDVFGAIIGLAQFTLTFQDNWVFVLIPASNDRKRPDVFALSPTSDPWFIELKGVAPLGSQIPQNGDLDTCKSVHTQRNKAVEQLEDELFVPGPGVPHIFARTFGVGFPSIFGSSIVASVTVLPDANLIQRSDIQPGGVKGCPPGSRCADHCLNGSFAGKAASLVNLLWVDHLDNKRIPSAAFKAWLASIHAVALGNWAGSEDLVREAMADLQVDTLAIFTQESAGLVFSALQGILVQCRATTSVKDRLDFVLGVTQHPILQSILISQHEAIAPLFSRINELKARIPSINQELPSQDSIDSGLVYNDFGNRFPLLGDPEINAKLARVNTNLARLLELVHSADTVARQAESYQVTLEKATWLLDRNRPDYGSMVSSLEELARGFRDVAREAFQIMRDFGEVAPLLEEFVQEAAEFGQAVEIADGRPIEARPGTEIKRIKWGENERLHGGGTRVGNLLRLAPAVATVKRRLLEGGDESLLAWGERALNERLGIHEHLPLQTVSLSSDRLPEGYLLGKRASNAPIWVSIDGRIEVDSCTL